MSSDWINALVTSSISVGLYGLYKVIQHYRVHSSCNQNNELVISVVDVNERPVNVVEEVKNEIQSEIKNNISV